MEPFKKQGRGPRVQRPEEIFGMGMHFTTQPLKDGFVKTLVNFNIENRGEVLRPRYGLRAKEVGILPKIATNPPLYTPEMMLAAGKDVVAFGDEIYKQVVLGQPSDQLIPGTTVYKGNGFVGTVYPKDKAYEGSGAAVIPDQLHAEVDTRAIHYMPLNDSAHADEHRTTFKRPMEAEIHGIKLANLDYIARHVGTFAFNNNYYYFKHVAQNTPSQMLQTKLDTNDPTKPRFIPEVIAPKEVSPKEAVLWGYNMLAENPYAFVNSETVGVIQLLGLLPYGSDGKLAMTPRVNQEIVLKCFYAAPTANSYEFLWEWKEPGADAWMKIKEETLNMATLPEASTPFSTPLKDVMFRVTVTKVGTTFPEKVLTVGFSFDKTQYGTTANVEAINYSIPKASGITYWKNRLVVYGLSEDPCVMLFSDVNDPSYFPYPHGAELFDEPIIHAMPFLDNLLVFTTSKLYLVTLDPTGTSWMKEMIQNNLDIKEWDIHLIKVVKNMVFFKSGNYYYMVVPRKGSNGELTIAPVTKSIEGLFDDFKINVDEIFKTLYKAVPSTELVHVYNFLDFEDIHNVYVFRETTSDLFINFVALYNTIDRTWRLHVYESQHIYMPYKQDATKKGTLMSLTSVDQRWNDVTTGLIPCVQFIQYDNERIADFSVPNNLRVYPAGTLPAEIEDPFTEYAAIHKYKNYQFLDTGYRDLLSNYKKRFREIQAKFNNMAEKALKFNHEVIIDGQSRHDIYRYKVEHDIDPASPNYGLITVIQELVDPTVLPKTMLIPGTTVLAESQDDQGAWTLDSSYFPELAFHKVRFPVSGKGFTPRLKLVSFNEDRYELLNTIWVFRPLNSR